MELSIALMDLNSVRCAAVQMVHNLRIDLTRDEAFRIKLAVGEVLTNCVEHGKCEVADVSAFKRENGDAVIEIKAPCYRDPALVQSWFEADCKKIDVFSERKRGCGVIQSVTKGIEYERDLIRLIFDLPVAGRVSVAV